MVAVQGIEPLPEQCNYMIYKDKMWCYFGLFTVCSRFLIICNDDFTWFIVVKYFFKSI